MHLYVPVYLIDGACYFLSIQSQLNIIEWPAVGIVFLLNKKRWRQQSEPKGSVVELLAADHLGTNLFKLPEARPKDCNEAFCIFLFWQSGLKIWENLGLACLIVKNYEYRQ